MPGRALPCGADRARWRVLHHRRVEGGSPAALVTALFRAGWCWLILLFAMWRIPSARPGNCSMSVFVWTECSTRVRPSCPAAPRRSLSLIIGVEALPGRTEHGSIGEFRDSRGTARCPGPEAKLHDAGSGRRGRGPARPGAPRGLRPDDEPEREGRRFWPEPAPAQHPVPLHRPGALLPPPARWIRVAGT